MSRPCPCPPPAPPGRVIRRPPRGARRSSGIRDGGQATPLVAVALVLAALAVLGLVGHGGEVLDAARARTAADAAALAGAAEGRHAATRLAGANGATLERYRSEGRDVVVTVQLGRARATARARREGTWCRPAGPSGSATSYTAPPCPSSQG